MTDWGATIATSAVVMFVRSLQAPARELHGDLKHSLLGSLGAFLDSLLSSLPGCFTSSPRSHADFTLSSRSNSFTPATLTLQPYITGLFRCWDFFLSNCRAGASCVLVSPCIKAAGLWKRLWPDFTKVDGNIKNIDSLVFHQCNSFVQMSRNLHVYCEIFPIMHDFRVIV